ncbi:hypothetical protein W97_07506 [Coniosporium apollinis CBS 100218]|uniref:Uncharacterized protein n=1 Tax=Coniosporium apollinis (strain CBS 100218) TaxID=1168221 RepID=R7Z2C8_CONA1|nr:uncharacterized protein W97_07506 [Coniosporium apollinis CBS 100218]EON68248.1 hypothetical protein W97_07506 [Coniosporium apollinis CBS 100218]
MSRKSLSPGAQLLRSSRLFSLPPPLPRPGSDISTFAAASKASDTSTLPHPIYQAITTPQSSLSRGDWGLKRALPLRSTTNTTTPAVRITALDTWEHITDFESAADHTRTLQKWQELNMPLAMPVSRNTVSGTSTAAKSVFEDYLDNTDPDPPAPTTPVLPGAYNSPSAASTERFRWRFKGPWVAGMTEAQFKRYITETVRKRKNEFEEYLRTHIKERVLAERRREYQNDGIKPPGPENGPEIEIKVSEEDIAAHIRNYRTEFADGKDLSNLIHDFLDLPQTHSTASFTKGKTNKVAPDILDTGPPSTHPSAGLSYLRSGNFMENHPVLGPQSFHTPVQARVLQPRKKTTGNISEARLGVAGVVVNDKRQHSHATGKEKGVESSDFDTEGGPKVWVTPLRATIDSSGKIKLEIERANPEPIDVRQGKLIVRTEQKPHEKDQPRQLHRMDEPLDARPARRSSSAWGQMGNPLR